MSGRGAIWAGALLALVVLMAGCATPMGSGGTSSRAEPGPGLEAQVFKLQKDTARIISQLESLGEQLEDGEGGACAEAAARGEEVERRVMVLEEQLLATQSRLDQVLLELRAIRRTAGVRPWAGSSGARPETPGDMPPEQSEPGGADEEFAEGEAPAGPIPDAPPEDLFNAAYADFSRGNYPVALEGFSAALQADPTGPMSSTAQYYIGETLLQMKRYDDAASAFDTLITAYPEGDRTPTAYLKKGIALFEGRREIEGVQTLEHVIETWPESDETRIAREYMRRRGVLPN